jgi:hypothetical protein
MTALDTARQAFTSGTTTGSFGSTASAAHLQTAIAAALISIAEELERFREFDGTNPKPPPDSTWIERARP